MNRLRQKLLQSYPPPQYDTPGVIVCTITTTGAACSVSRVVMVKDTVEPKKYDKDKRGEILLLVHVCEKENIKGKMRPERITLKSSSSGTGPEALEQSRLSLRERQRSIVGMSTAADGSLELGGIISL